jgi:hypothetical protein
MHPDSERAMLRWAIPFLLTIVAVAPAAAAHSAVARHGHHTVARLPAGLPRAHYKYRTTVTYNAPAPPVAVYVERDPDVLFTPTVPYVPLFTHEPLLPGSSTLPGYYGLNHSYDYQGPYYGGPNLGYWYRLPYACGVYGYC